MKRFITKTGERRINYIHEDSDDRFEATYRGHTITITYDENDSRLPKPWYARCISISGSYAVDGWVGETKEEAIIVCIESII